MVTQFLPGRGPDPAAVRGAAWVARCVGRGETVPLGPEDVAALAGSLQTRSLQPGQVLFAAGTGPAGVWLVRSGQVELAVGSGRRRAVLAMLGEGDVDGDIPLLLRMPPPYTARAVDRVECLFLSPEEFDRLITSRGQLARRWLTSVAARLASSQGRLVGLLGGTLTAQTARLLLDEADRDGRIALSQATIAAMLGARRPSVNKVLGELANAGLIEVSYRSIRLLDTKGLGALA
ncbi:MULTISPECIES: Crp/Fnr family transcriptional regulator [unclassified Nocardioides]|uniref:Crp/Fnr family transcriptional regulator n=1 Tax=unclassified Nocardioides TaxID=2615069 RepID=UPI0009F029FD|nr:MULTISPECIES: Crp/Fnr family transcriptional regulator [unclassified Nocardioides]GAW49232.1 Transcriptional regulator, Crp/Fnr family [Nocardioides sp. PD653-B2]GAW55720.1 Transcriptional regulator, Crp/Fnr family [Nocardioides sp. PD653]